MKLFTIAAVALGIMTTTSEAVQINSTSTSAAVAALASVDVNCVNDYCTTSEEYCGDWKGRATLRRIPLWGAEMPESYINF